MKLIGHRASCGYFTENSMEAIEYSNKIDIDGIEIDIQFTSDNYPIISHDRTLERLFNKEIFIHDILKEDMHNFTGIVFLEEVLEKINPKLQLFLEIKGEFNLKGCKKILDILEKFSFEKYKNKNERCEWLKKVSICSYNQDICKYFNDMKIYLNAEQVLFHDRIINYNVFFITNNTFNINILNQIFQYCDGYVIHHENVNKEVVDYCNKYNKSIYVYTINSRILFNYINKFNINGVISDVPLELK